MSYSTTLYAVDIGALSAAIGSGDESLLQRLRDANAAADDTLSEVELPGDVTLRITGEGQVLFNDQPMTLEEVSRAVLSIESGTLEVVMEYPWTKQHEAVVLANNENIPKSGIEQVITRWECHDPTISKNLDQTPHVTWSRTEVDEDEDNSSFRPNFGASDDALSDLVFGNLDSSGPEHGYALEVMCFVLGKFLPDDDLIGDLEPLELDTPLQQPRNPVPLNEYSDFPVISFLKADEVAAESRRLSNLALDFPDDEDIEEPRNAFSQCVRIAADKRLGIVSFYR